METSHDSEYSDCFPSRICSLLCFQGTRVLQHFHKCMSYPFKMNTSSLSVQGYCRSHAFFHCDICERPPIAYFFVSPHASSSEECVRFFNARERSRHIRVSLFLHILEISFEVISSSFSREIQTIACLFPDQSFQKCVTLYTGLFLAIPIIRATLPPFPKGMCAFCACITSKVHNRFSDSSV